MNVFDWKPYFLPKPSSIWAAFTDNFDLIRSAAAVSGANALDRACSSAPRSASPSASC